jgi:diadenosine tetraphosphate (Ap4A) HIT family hydrolase
VAEICEAGAARPDCPFCAPVFEHVLWRDERCRVLLADEPGYPGFCRVVWQEHVREVTDLAPADRRRLMAVVFGVEAALRELLSPCKVNLASLGNQVPHLHWHVIPRFTDDPHFPDAVWAAAQRPAPATPAPDPEVLARAIARHLSVSPPSP